MGASTLCIFIRPLIEGMEGMRLVYIHFLSFGYITLHSLTAVLVTPCRFFGHVLVRGREVVRDKSVKFFVVFACVYYSHGVAFVCLNNYGTSFLQFGSD